MKRIDNGPVYALTDGTGYSIHHVDENEMDEPMQAWTVPDDGLLDDELMMDLAQARGEAIMREIERRAA